MWCRCDHWQFQPTKEEIRRSGYFHDRRTAKILQRNEKARLQKTSEASSPTKGNTIVVYHRYIIENTVHHSNFYSEQTTSMDFRHRDASNVRNHHHDFDSLKYDNHVGGARKHEHKFRISSRIYQLYFHRDFHWWVRIENVCPEASLLSKPLELFWFRCRYLVNHWLNAFRIYQAIFRPTYAFPYNSSSPNWTYFTVNPRCKGNQDALICFDDVFTSVAEYRTAALFSNFYLFDFRNEPVCLRKTRWWSRRHVQFLHFWQFVPLPLYDNNFCR